MIPKIIHFCWFGGRNYSKMINKCMETWNHHLRDYQFIRWDEKNSPMKHPFVVSTYKNKRYAFVSDYVRLKALYDYGGIYLDTDMYIIKNLDALLNNTVFFGFEESNCAFISAGIIGSTPGNTFIQQVLKHYDQIEFDNTNVQNITIPKIITETYLNYQHKNEIEIFPWDYFYPLPNHTKYDINNLNMYIHHNTLAIHLWNRSWFTLSDYLRSVYGILIKKLQW